MPDLQQPLMIITDLDGSLLDHHTYRWDAATEWLTTLKQHKVQLVICSSKTAAEVIPLQKKTGDQWFTLYCRKRCRGPDAGSAAYPSA